MTAYIYQSKRRQGTYLYLAKRDDFDCIPLDSRQALEPFLFSMELDLHPQRKLRKEDPLKVMASLNQRGFYIQLADDIVEALLRRAAGLDDSRS